LVEGAVLKTVWM